MSYSHCPLTDCVLKHNKGEKAICKMQLKFTSPQFTQNAEEDGEEKKSFFSKELFLALKFKSQINLPLRNKLLNHSFPTNRFNEMEWRKRKIYEGKVFKRSFSHDCFICCQIVLALFQLFTNFPRHLIRFHLLKFL